MFSYVSSAVFCLQARQDRRGQRPLRSQARLPEKPKAAGLTRMTPANNLFEIYRSHHAAAGSDHDITTIASLSRSGIGEFVLRAFIPAAPRLWFTRLRHENMRCAAPAAAGPLAAGAVECGSATRIAPHYHGATRWLGEIVLICLWVAHKQGCRVDGG